MLHRLCSSTKSMLLEPRGETRIFSQLWPCTAQLKFATILHRYDSNSGGEREIQRTMLELLNQLDGFDSRGDVKVSLGFIASIGHYKPA